MSLRYQHAKITILCQSIESKKKRKRFDYLLLCSIECWKSSDAAIVLNALISKCNSSRHFNVGKNSIKSGTEA